MWMIQADFNSSFYWSNSWGWVDENTADSFTPDERKSLSLPLAGRWVWVEDMDIKQMSRSRKFIEEMWA